MSTNSSWLALQIGAREHYAIPRALHRVGLLHRLFTDFWAPTGLPVLRFLPSKALAGRFHTDLSSASVHTPWLRSLPFELRSRLALSPSGWPRTIARNAWFQRWAVCQLRRLKQPGLNVFSYSYASSLIFQMAHERGYPCVLGQMDPGPEEERLVLAEQRRYPHLAGCWQPAPAQYWKHWDEELELADRIVVNSFWSQSCLLRQGVPASKLRLIPLVYEPSVEGASAPPAPARPFQLLFLGTIGLRKGIARLLVAMRLLQGQPVQLTLAGPSELDPQAWATAPNIRWLGPVPRSQVASLYGQAQAMILPTLSDGFAITQLEALAHGCPVIASRFCGEVVTPGLNGWLLSSLEPEAIVATIVEAMDTAHLLPRPLQRPAFGLPELADALQQLNLPTVCP
jgi:glycosyltransferase involved in cell wall biosynthesis